MITTDKKKTLMSWVKKFGFWGFMFFLLKGLVWLAIGYFIVK